jgi:isopentenyldiphosphate isomerase
VTHLAQDPNELFDVIDVHGMPTGVVKRRADVHRAGDWHRAIHVWIYGEDDDGAFIVVQRRGLDKDTWPGAIDATAAGHLTAGETPEGAFREIEEELGITPDLRQLQHVGTRVIAGEEPPDRMDQEFEEVYLLRDDRPLTGYRPNSVEVDALLRIPLKKWLRLLFAETDEVETQLLISATMKLHNHRLTRDPLVPSPDRYYQRVAVACARALKGERYLVV